MGKKERGRENKLNEVNLKENKLCKMLNVQGKGTENWFKGWWLTRLLCFIPPTPSDWQGRRASGQSADMD